MICLAVMLWSACKNVFPPSPIYIHAQNDVLFPLTQEAQML